MSSNKYCPLNDLWILAVKNRIRVRKTKITYIIRTTKIISSIKKTSQIASLSNNTVKAQEISSLNWRKCKISTNAPVTATLLNNCALK